jgi:aryl-alcohol dehydrogenase-like predicted oxidoreductase
MARKGRPTLEANTEHRKAASVKRRFFLRIVGGTAGAGALAAAPVGNETGRAAEPIERVEGLPRRVLGRTGEKVSIVGFPGLALMHLDQAGSNKAVRSAFDRGVNYFDVAPAYGDAEEKMGPALQGIPRDKIFLACKTKMRDKEGARKELERSLTRLKTDHFDLYQLHHIVRPEQVKQATGPGGAMETLLKAQQEGKIRYFGFSAHTTKGAVALMREFRFHTAMFPISFAEFLSRGFGKAVLDLAAQQDVAVLAIKALSRGTWPEGVKRTRDWWYRPMEEPADVSLALRFTLSQKGVVVAFTPAFVDLLDKAIDAARSYTPISEPDVEKLRQMAAGTGSIFKQEEDQVARGKHGPVHPDSPHEDCPGTWG